MQINFLIPSLLGLVVGLLMGLTGSGGGIVSVPLLIFGLGLPLNVAAPIALASMAVSAGLGAYLGFRAKILRYKAAALMSATGLILSPFGLWVSHLIPDKPLIIGFGVLLIFVSIRMLVQAQHSLKSNLLTPRTAALCELNPDTGKFTWTRSCLSVLFITGGTTGFLSGLLGVGGGFMLVPALRKFTNLPMQSIVATTLGVIAIVSAGSALMASATGDMNWSIATPFICGSVIGLMLGRKLIERLHSSRVQQVFAVFTFCIALELIYKNIF